MADIEISRRSRSRSRKTTKRSQSRSKKNKKISDYILKENSLKQIANSRGYTERYENSVLTGSKKLLYPLVGSNSISRKSSITRRKSRCQSFGKKYSDDKMKKSQSLNRKKKSQKVKLPKNSRTRVLTGEEMKFLNSLSGGSIEEYNSQVHNLEKFLKHGNLKFKSSKAKNFNYDYPNQEILIENLEECKKFNL